MTHNRSLQDLKVKHEYSNEKVFVENVFNFSTLASSAVANFGNVNLGASATLDIKSTALKTHTVAASLTHQSSVVNVGVFVHH